MFSFLKKLWRRNLRQVIEARLSVIHRFDSDKLALVAATMQHNRGLSYREAVKAAYRLMLYTQEYQNEEFMYSLRYNVADMPASVAVSYAQDCIKDGSAGEC